VVRTLFVFLLVAAPMRCDCSGEVLTQQGQAVLALPCLDVDRKLSLTSLKTRSCSRLD
jgi:hypothetical protein